MRKSWSEKARKAKPAHVVVLEKSFAGVPAGATLLITAPDLIAAYMRAIPRGERRSIGTMRADLAKQHQADATCPVTSAIHARIVAEMAIEDLAAGAPAEALIPFWRAVEPNSALAKKLSIGVEGLQRLQATNA
jgi:hypothetical protein